LTTPVPHSVNLFLVAVLLFGGTVLVFDAFSGPDASQTAKILGGATCVSLGLVCGWFLVASWFKWRKLLKQDQNE